MSATTTDDELPEFPSVEQIAHDLDLSNQEGGSYFEYSHDAETDTLAINLYEDSGEIVKTFAATITFKETTA